MTGKARGNEEDIDGAAVLERVVEVFDIVLQCCNVEVFLMVLQC